MLFHTYLIKNASGERLIQANPEKGLKYIVVIPAYIETRAKCSLVSLFNATHPPNSPVEIIVLINWPDDESLENIKLSKEILNSTEKFATVHSSQTFSIHIKEVTASQKKPELDMLEKPEWMRQSEGLKEWNRKRNYYFIWCRYPMWGQLFF